jgi:hypothetical protein
VRSRRCPDRPSVASGLFFPPSPTGLRPSTCRRGIQFGIEALGRGGVGAALAPFLPKAPVDPVTSGSARRAGVSRPRRSNSSPGSSNSCTRLSSSRTQRARHASIHSAPQPHERQAGRRAAAGEVIGDTVQGPQLGQERAAPHEFLMLRPAQLSQALQPKRATSASIHSRAGRSVSNG